MWHRLKNIFLSLTTYCALSPDLRVRRQVNQGLIHRPALKLDAWITAFCQPLGVTEAIATFAYVQLSTYSGLQFAHILPSDRLEADLKWTQVCWFDWETTLFKDVWQTFGVDISHTFYTTSIVTVADLLVFLNQELHGMEFAKTNSQIDSVNL